MTNSNIPSTIPEHPFAAFIRILGKGKSGTRSLSQDEARQSFGMILRKEVEPLQLGAFLMLLRVKEESPEELAGFVQACRTNMVQPPAALRADLDWSSYAGKKHQHPWYILSMLLLAQAGHRVFVHGSAGHTSGRLYTENAMRELGLPIAANWSDVSRQLDADHLSYLPLEHFCAPLQELMQLRHFLGLRSPVNTLSRMINPLCARASLQSIFHPAYARLHQEADLILGQSGSIVFKGESGEVEVKPHADTRLYVLHQQQMQEELMPRSIAQRVESVGAPDVGAIRALWRGETTHRYGLDAALATTAAGLLILEPELGLESAQLHATQLWHNRNISRLS